jgi:circadian clock protein KaiB
MHMKMKNEEPRRRKKPGAPRASESSPTGSPSSDPSVAEFEQALREAEKLTYVLRLYVTGVTPRSQRAIENIRKLCDEHLAGRYNLEIIDIYQQPGAAKAEQILAAPTLLKKLPLPLRRILGDISQPDRVLVALGLKVGGETDKNEK